MQSSSSPLPRLLLHPRSRPPHHPSRRSPTHLPSPRLRRRPRLLPLPSALPRLHHLPAHLHHLLSPPSASSECSRVVWPWENRGALQIVVACSHATKPALGTAACRCVCVCPPQPPPNCPGECGTEACCCAPASSGYADARSDVACMLAPRSSLIFPPSSSLLYLLHRSCACAAATQTGGGGAAGAAGAAG